MAKGVSWGVFDWRELSAGPLAIFRDGNHGLARAQKWADDNLGEHARIARAVDHDTRLFAFRHLVADAVKNQRPCDVAEADARLEELHDEDNPIGLIDAEVYGSEAA
jgi:hypothetical protein